MSKIELRLSDVNPPEPEPSRTIYRDIVDLPDPVKLGITIRYFNYDDVSLYFQITGSATGYTFGTVNLGLLASGSNAYRNLDEFASRAKPQASDMPSGEKEENIKLTLKAYTDSNYTNLKWTFERTVTVHWINSAVFTLDVSNNFDDGTTQGWAVACESNCKTGYPTLGVATDYVLSPPYSLKMYTEGSSANEQFAARLYKSFITPNKEKVFAVFNVRLGTLNNFYAYIKNLSFKRDNVTLIFLGKPTDGTGEHYLPLNKWMRVVVPLPKNATIELRLILWAKGGQYLGPNTSLWLDDFRIVSKD